MVVAKKWNFSAETCQVILHYQDPLEELYTDTPQDEKTLVVRLANLIAHAAQVGSPEGYPVDPEEMKKIALLIGFDETTVNDDLPKLIEETKERFAAESHIYS